MNNIGPEPKIYLIPRWGGTAHSDWYDWFKDQVILEHKLSIQTMNMPNWHQPDVAEAVGFLSREIGELDSRTFFIGHSVGCQAILRFLLTKVQEDENLRIGGFLFVAGWLNVNNPWGSLIPWLDNTSLDYKRISQRIAYRKVIISNNDPFNPDFNLNQKSWKERLDANVDIYPGKAHFNQKEGNEVLKEFNEMLLYTTKNKLHK